MHMQFTCQTLVVADDGCISALTESLSIHPHYHYKWLYFHSVLLTRTVSDAVHAFELHFGLLVPLDN